jgi:TRAP-type C4-dicarboxylate transport system permease small subunit
MRILTWLDKNFEESFCITLMAVMTIFICGQVFTRYVLQMAMSWTEEISRYLFIWTVYVGISYGVKKNRHICIDVIYNLLPEKYSRYFAHISDLLFLGFTLFIMVQGYGVFLRIVASGQTSPACEIPMWMVYGALPFGMALSSFRIAQGIWRRTIEMNGKRAAAQNTGE